MAILLVVSVGCGPSSDDEASRDEDSVTHRLETGPTVEPAPAVATGTSVNADATVTSAVEPEPDLKYPVPHGSAADLAVFLSDLAVRDAQGSTPEETNADLAEIMKSRIYAAERMLAIPDADPLFRLMASEAKLESLRTLALSGQGEQSEFADFAGELTQSANVAISQVGRIGQLQHTLDEVRSLGVVDTAALLSSIREISSKVNRDDHPDLRVLYALSETNVVLQEVEELDAAIEVLTIGADLLAIPKGDTRTTLDITIRFARDLEAVGQIDATGKLLEVIEKKFGDHADPTLRTEALEVVHNARRRISQIGEKVTIQGDVVEGDAFDPESVNGKVVLLQFWTTFSPTTNARFAELQQLHRRYHEAGFEIVGVCLDEDDAAVTAYLTGNDVPWPTIHNRNTSLRGASDPNAQSYGIEPALTPYSYLVDASGSIVDLNSTCDELRDAIPELLRDSETAASQTGQPSESTEPQSNDEETAAAENGDSQDRKEATDESTKANEQESDRPADAADDAYSERADTDASTTQAIEKDTEDQPVGEASTVVTEVAERNPYAPPEGLSAVELAEFILEMQDKTRSIQHRDGFVAGIVEASNRILQSDAPDRFQVIAALAKFKYLHREASTGDERATTALNEMIVQFQDDTRPRIAPEVAFLTAEKNVLEAEEKSADDVIPDIESAITFFAQSKETDLDARRLRMASATVGLINKIEDANQRQDYFQQLGQHLAKSSDKHVARYGKRIGNVSPADEGTSNLVGQPLEIEGETVDGVPFDWQEYRGRVVLVDFWATWCGPCRAMMPKIEALYHQEHERGFDVVGISLDEDLDQLADFLAEHAFPWTLLAGEDTNNLADKYNVRGIPMLMLVDTTGKVVAAGNELEAVTRELDSLLEQRNES